MRRIVASRCPDGWLLAARKNLMALIFYEPIR